MHLAEKSKDSVSIFKSLNNIGIIYKSQGNYDKALSLYERGLKIEKKRGNKEMVASTMNNIAAVYILKSNYNEARKKLEEALVISRGTENKYIITDCLGNLGDLHSELKQYKLAIAYYEESKEINEQVNDQEGLCQTLLGLANIYVNQANYTKALDYTLKGINIAKSLKLVKIQKDAHELLTIIYKNTNQFDKALKNHESFKLLSDSIFNKKNIEKITQLEYEYKYKEELENAQEKEVQLTEKVKITTNNLEKSQRNLLIGIITFLAIAILLGGIIFTLKLRNEKAKNQTILTEQKLLRTQMNPHFIF